MLPKYEDDGSKEYFKKIQAKEKVDDVNTAQLNWRNRQRWRAVWRKGAGVWGGEKSMRIGCMTSKRLPGTFGGWLWKPVRFG